MADENKNNAEQNTPETEIAELKEQLKRAWALTCAACDTLENVYKATFGADKYDQTLLNMGIIREKCKNFLTQSGWFEHKRQEEEKAKQAAAEKKAEK